MKIKLTDRQSVLPVSLKLAIAAAAGLAVGALMGMALSWKFAPIVMWDVAAVTYLATTWFEILGFNAALAKKHALREDPSRVVSDVVLLVASVASLAAVGIVLIGAASSSGPAQFLQAALGLASVVVSWGVVHTVYALRYAELYYQSPSAPVDFGDTKSPVYTDFAYLAFTLGMTFQVSDTALGSGEMRKTALKHALLSYLFGTVIIASTINLIAGLGQ
jgi:uncharacterized membrane protein